MDLIVLKLLMAGVLAYFIGSFPTGVILGKMWGGIDVRQVGSTHTGGMNVIRSVGIGAGILTALVDAAKGVIAVAIGQALTHSPWSVPVTGVMATAGHCWSLYAGFHGGMGLSTLGAIFFYLQPLAVLAVVPLWFVLYIVIRHPPSNHHGPHAGFTTAVVAAGRAPGNRRSGPAGRRGCLHQTHSRFQSSIRLRSLSALLKFS